MNIQKRLEMMNGLPERERWRMLQSAIDLRLDWSDTTINRLDSRMQGLLFLQDHVRNGPARIAFVRDKRNMAYLRDAAGSRNVTMSDAEFDALVEENDSETLAGFGRCEAMQPHHLLYIEHQLERLPHRQPALASAYDVKITVRKVLESTGVTREVALLRLARAALFTGWLLARLRLSVAEELQPGEDGTWRAAARTLPSPATLAGEGTGS